MEYDGKTLQLLLYALLAMFAISTQAMAVYNWDGFPMQREAADNAASCNGISIHTI
jgi:hypothetical protein